MVTVAKNLGGDHFEFEKVQHEVRCSMLSTIVAMISACIIAAVAGFFEGRRSPQLRGWFFLIYITGVVFALLVISLPRMLFDWHSPTQAYYALIAFSVWALAAEVGVHRAKRLKGKNAKH